MLCMQNVTSNAAGEMSFRACNLFWGWLGTMVFEAQRAGSA